MGPQPAALAGRALGQDFELRDGWRMYHGDVVPGFPRHPHRGFETVTIGRSGFIDHSDSLGATARFGRGDVQWMTAGRGIVHAEMFPLVHRDQGNRTELLQIWLNLPRPDKLADPYFTMMWREQIPVRELRDQEGRATEVTAVVGGIDGASPPPPPSHSWAARPEAEVAIWLIAMEPGARWTVPAAGPGSQRSLYFFRGGDIDIGGRGLTRPSRVELRPGEAPIANGAAPSELLLLQGRPLDEPVAQYGPFVMNHPDEIRQAIADYQRTGFGAWPWPSDGPVHPRDRGRFAIHADGRLDDPTH
jgi:hypothetical protein